MAVVVEEAPRPPTKEEVGPYYEEYRGRLFANAHCQACGAKYLAWFSKWVGGHHFEDSEVVTDLSYRAAFNDEALPEDLPTHEVRRTVIIEHRPIGMIEWTVVSKETEKVVLDD